MNRRLAKICAAPISMALLVHVALDLMLLLHPWHFHGSQLWIALGLPVSQNGLIAIWAGMQRMPGYARLLVVSLGVPATWFVACRCMSWNLHSDLAAAWAASFLAQSLVIVLAIRACRMWFSGNINLRRKLPRFSLAQTLLWIAALSLPLTLLRLGMMRLGWTLSVFQWQLFPHLKLLGVCNGLCAVLALIPFVSRWRVPWDWCIAGLCATLLMVLELAAFRFVFVDSGGITLVPSLTLCGTYLLILLATLVPVTLERGAWPHSPHVPQHKGVPETDGVS